MLGKEQRRWFKSKLEQSRAKHKVVVSSVPFLAPFEHDSWYGFRHERDRLRRLVRKTPIEGVIVLSGDFHCAWELGDPDSHIREFIAGPLAAWPFASIKTKHLPEVEKSGHFSMTKEANFGQLLLDGTHASVSYFDKTGKRRYHVELS